MHLSEDEVEFKVDNLKVKVSNQELSNKYIRKIHTKQKVNNVLVECESYERYEKCDTNSPVKELTFWVEIKMFGKHKYKPKYNYELHANINSKYNQLYNTTTTLKQINKGDEDYKMLERFLIFG